MNFFSQHPLAAPVTILPVAAKYRSTAEASLPDTLILLHLVRDFRDTAIGLRSPSPFLLALVALSPPSVYADRLCDLSLAPTCHVLIPSPPLSAMPIPRP